MTITRNGLARSFGASLALAVIALFAAAPSAGASGASLVRDIDPGSASSLSFSSPVTGPYPDRPRARGKTFFLPADDGVHGEELWRSDGTAAGTKMVRDICPGAHGSDPLWLTNVAGTVFFSARDGTHGRELWRSDGSRGGTKMVRDIRPGGYDSGSSPTDVTNVRGTVFFTAWDGTHGIELWRSDGTAAGTKMVRDINPGNGGYGESTPQDLTQVGGDLMFVADDGTNGYELWRSDGTAAGTKMVRDIYPGPGSSGAEWLTNVGGKLFFRANDGVHEWRLWGSDGTAAGTEMVNGSPYGPDWLANVAGTLFFNADDGAHGYELWRSDGTAAGTKMFATSTPEPGGRGRGG